MDPFTAIGAAASIVALAQTALALSISLYSLGGALLSASEDLQNLADDLKIFSRSLTVISRLLEDNKTQYSDGVYLLMGDVIKRCSDLYVKIDRILSKLSGKGLVKRVKFVGKESQIQKLLDRLNNLKVTWTIILQALQVDLR